MTLELFVWAIIGGLFVAILSSCGSYYLNESPSNKQLSRDFLIGAGFTGILFPLIPESFNEIKEAITTTAETIKAGVPGVIIDQDIKIGPANF
jgi:peptidoglycan/LPS O-acetylase OafA/YrhL